jgi:kexin
MLDDSNLERLEHVTARVWIDHERRGDVEVELLSPSGQLSVLARQRRFDDATTGFAGWKFMSVKHWYAKPTLCHPTKLTSRDENPVGTWTITVKDAANPDKIGRFVAWSLQLWGESVDPALTKPWAPAEEGQPDEEQTGSDPTTVINQKPKPTDHLPDDHASAPGESHLPGLVTTTVADAVEPTTTSGQSEELGEPGFLGGVTDLASSSSWLAGAGGIILLAGVGVGAFFLLRARNKRRNLFGLANNGEGGARGDYAPVSEDVPMGLLERGRRKLGGRGAGGAAGSKDLYDAFGDGPSDESEDDDAPETGALRYHDDFLDDEGDERRSREEEDDQPERQVERSEAIGSGSGSSGSWQDAADEVRP